MNPSNFPHGLGIYGIPILPPGVSLPTTGNVFFVDSNGPSSGDQGTGTFDNPWNTINYAVTQCVANHDDVIYVKQGHVETVSAASGLLFNIAGVTVIFLGVGSKKGTITFTATTATMVVSAANVRLINPRFLTGIDAVAAAINVQAADFKMYNVEYYDAAAKATTIQLLTTAAADRMLIDGYRFFVSSTGTQKTDGLKIVGGTGITLKNIEIEGDFSVGCVDNASTAGTNWYFENLFLNNLNSGPQPGLVLQAATTGIGLGVRVRIASGTTFVSASNKFVWFASYGANADGYFGQPIGTSESGDLPAVIGTRAQAAYTTATANTTASMMQFIKALTNVNGLRSQAGYTSAAVNTTASMIQYIKAIHAGHGLPSQAAFTTGAANTVGTVLQYIKAIHQNALGAAVGAQRTLNLLQVVATMTSATWRSKAKHQIGVVSGTVRVRILAAIGTTAITGTGPKNMVIKLGMCGNTAAIIAATTAGSTTTFVANGIWCTSANTSASHRLLAYTSLKDYIVANKNLGYEITTVSATGGTLTFNIWWEALTPNSKVTAGVGGVIS